jgi:hypothetical protein
VKEIDLTIPEGKPGAAPAKIDSGAIEKGRKLLQRAQTAMGGADKLAAVKDTFDVIELEMSTPQGTMKGKQEIRFIAPNHFRQAMELPFGKIDIYYDGKTGWFASPQGVMDVPPPVAKQVQGGIFRALPTLMLSDRNPERTVAAAGDSAVEISDKSGNSAKVDFDPSTGLPSKVSYKSVAMTGEPAAVAETLSNFRPINGVMLPQKSVVEQNGQKFADVTIIDSKINSGLTVEQLAKKP